MAANNANRDAGKEKGKQAEGNQRGIARDENRQNREGDLKRGMQPSEDNQEELQYKDQDRQGQDIEDKGRAQGMQQPRKDLDVELEEEDDSAEDEGVQQGHRKADTQKGQGKFDKGQRQ